MKFRSMAWLFLVLLACQSQHRNKSTRPVNSQDTRPDKGAGPTFEPDPVVTPDSMQSSTPNKPGSNSENESPGDLTTIEAELGSIPIATNPNLPFGLPEMHRSGSSILISRPEFVLAWNRETRNLDWAAWKLQPSDLGPVERTDYWDFDADLEKYLAPFGETAVRFNEYSGSCFDRGHQVPSADRTKDEAMNKATFVMSNALPQTAFLNQIIWNAHERDVRSLLQGENCLWIVAGPVYGDEKDNIGPENDIAVPTSTFKAVFGCESPATLRTAVIMPNVNGDGASRVADKKNCRLLKGKLSTSPADYAADVKTIETKAHIKLLKKP